MDSPEILKNILRRERKARKAAEAIIEQKSLELYLSNKNLQELNNSLEEKIIERTWEIQKSKEALKVEKEKAEEATRAKSEFLSNMSHEIRTPLNAIVGLTELIIQDGEDPKSVEFASTIRYSANNLMHIINEILDFSSIEAGKISFEKTEFNLEELLKSVENIFQFQAKEKKLDFFLEADKRIPKYLIGDPTRLNQIIVNLVGNAFKFTSQGFIRIYFKLIESNGFECSLVGSVEDTGIGIPQSRLQSIFRSFEQADNSTKRLYGGTGLGLTITQKLVELQGGKIWVESELDKGSRFKFEMPFQIAQKSIKTEKESKKKIDYSALQNYTILVVEDVKVNRLLMEQVFKRIGLEVDFAVNGKESIETLSKKNYDIVLMDIHMPVMDGKEAVQIIRDENSPVLNHDVPVVALSADAFEETRKEVLELGMDGFLTKPVEIEKLYETLYAILVDE